MSTPTQTADLSAAVAAEIRAIMAYRLITQAQLAARLGVSEMWVSRKLRGRQVIDLNDLQRIAIALDTDAVALVTRSANGRLPAVPVRPTPTVPDQTMPMRPLSTGPDAARSRPPAGAPARGPRDRSRRPVRLPRDVAA